MKMKYLAVLGILISFAVSSSVLAQDAVSQETLEADSMIQSGYSRLDLKDYTGAETIFKESIAKYPQNAKAPDMQLRLGYIQICKKAPKADVIAAFDETAKAYPDSSEAAQALYRSALTRISDIMTMKGNTSEKYMDAEEAFKRAAAHPKTPHGQAATCVMQTGFLHVMCYHELVQEKIPADAAESVKTSLVASEKAELESGHKILKECSINFQDVPTVQMHALHGMGEIEILQGDYASAEKTYESISKMDSTAYPFETSFGLYGLGMAQGWDNKRSSMSETLTAFLNAVPGSNLVEKDTAWRKEYPWGYARVGLAAVQQAWVEIARNKYYVSKDTEGAYQDLVEFCTSFPTASNATIKEAQNLRDLIGKKMSATTTGEVSK